MAKRAQWKTLFQCGAIWRVPATKVPLIGAAFLSLTGHLLQKPRGEAMNAKTTLLLCAGYH
ncbi:MAG: hypothetical protein DLM68_07770 [Hyphomicrobiales bacterium]|nr:MAG: hypothetical protein DLM68_07770 [Hyphomicrobiales bacterium]